MRQALAEPPGPTRWWVVLRDDLAVGPLSDIDSTGLIRSGFWQRVAPHSDIDFAAEMRQALDQLQDVRKSETEVAIWHGQSASDQLMLRRVVFHLYQAPQRINEVALDVRELDMPAHSHLASVGMYPAARLARRFSTIARSRCCAWDGWATVAAMRQENADVRLWKGNTLVPAPHGGRRDPGALPGRMDARRAGGGRRDGRGRGLLASDWFVFWRCRELIGTGQRCCAAMPIPCRPANCAATSWPARSNRSDPQHGTYQGARLRAQREQIPTGGHRLRRQQLPQHLDGRPPAAPPAALPRRACTTTTKARKRSCSTCSTAIPGG